VEAAAVSIRAGKLDRRLTIQRKVVTTSPSGEQIETWSSVAVVWGEAKPLPGDEKFGDQQLIASSIMTFRIRWRTDMTVQDKIIHWGKTWDILDIREIGRREGLEIDAKARTDV
jgi:SPP1 family predicted phage head-tail adaptor